MRRKGFTLIELLVVIAIIAILAAILFPVFAKARGKARQATCVSNVKQVSLGVLMYCQDYDETYPPASTAGAGAGPDGLATGSSYYTWAQLIYPYTKNHKIIQCPDSPFTGSDAAALWFSYGINSYLAADYWHGRPVTSDAAVKTPADKYMIMDWPGHVASIDSVFNVWYYSSAGGGDHYLPGQGSLVNRNGNTTYANASNNSFPSDFTTGRHNGGVVVGFCDGHSKWMKVGVLLQDAIDKVYGTKTPAESGWMATD